MIERFSDFDISAYREKDFDDIARTFAESYTQTYPDFDKKFHQKERFRLILSENVLLNSRVWVARNNSQPVGFLALGKNFIDQLYIKKEFQGRGLGSFWVERSKQIYPNLLELYTFECNKKANSFYHKHGFEIIERGIAPDEQMPDVKMRWKQEN